MKRYKHYSFDLWLTLIKSNPEFKLKRAEYFHQHFNRDNKSVSEIQAIIKDIDDMCNSVNEKVGYNIDAFEMYAMILHRLNYDFKHFQFRDLHSIYHSIEQIFFQYAPHSFDINTREVLGHLKRSGATVSILSNTGFIKGITLKKLLQEKFHGLIDFQIYSDEVGMSKPSAHLFRNMINLVHAMRAHHPVLDSDIIHVGDNPIADIQGATLAGIDSLLINSNGITIKNLID